MSAFSLNSIDLATYGITPGHSPGSNIAMQGCYDLPSRIGQTSYEWAETNIEPWVSADEIFFGGRDLKFYGTILGTNKVINDYLQALYDAVEAFTDLVALVTPYGTFNVQVKTIVPEYYVGACRIVITFRELVVGMPSVVKYGYLYNWYAVNTGKLAPVGWHIPTQAEWTDLEGSLGGWMAAGGKLKETGTTHWTPPNTNATNETGFTALPGGFRGEYSGATFENIMGVGYFWASDVYVYNPANGFVKGLLYYSGTFYYQDVAKTCGCSARPVKNSTTLSIGQTGTVTDIDGNVYRTKCMPDGKEWFTENLAVKHYNDGTPIPNVTDNTAWAALTTGAYCAYDNLETNAIVSLPATGTSINTIDSIPMSSFGLYYSKGGGLRNLSEMKEQFFTKYGEEGYQMAKRKTRSFDFKAVLMGSSLTDFENKVRMLYLLFSSAGMRDVIINNEIQITCFAVEGFTIENIILYNTGMIADFRITLICTSVSLITVDSTTVAVDDTVVTVDEP